MLFVRKNLLSVGTHTVKVSTINVINQDSPTERILINCSHEQGSVPVISYSVAGYDMLNQVLDKYGCQELEDLKGKEVEVVIFENNNYLNAKFGSNTENSDEPTL